MGEPDELARTPAPGDHDGARVECRAAIQASAATVWNILADVDGWSRWNPLYSEASGSILTGDRLLLAVVLPGMKPQKTSATVIASVPNRRLQYQSRGLGGLTRGTRFVEIEETSPASCTIANGEMMGGPIGPLLARLLGDKVRQAIQGMTDALKQVAEASATERPSL